MKPIRPLPPPPSSSRAELLWFGVVLILGAMGIFGSIEPDSLRAFAPRGTVLYVSWVDHGVRSGRAYLADGSLADLRDGYGVTLEKSGDVSDTHIDPYMTATPWENLRIRFSSAYGVSLIGKRAELLFGTRADGMTVLSSGAPVALAGTEIQHLPASLLLWSTRGEPIATMNATDRESLVEAEGRYGKADEPSVLLRATVPDPEAILKLLTAFQTPSLTPFPLGDGSIAKEIIADTDVLVAEPVTGAIGTGYRTIGTRRVPAYLALPTATSSGIAALLFSDSSALTEYARWSPERCPIFSLESFVQKPFFALGTDVRNTFVFCAE
jgi:hypothetical protein